MGLNICGKCGHVYSRTYHEQCTKCGSQLRELAVPETHQQLPPRANSYEVEIQDPTTGESHREYRQRLTKHQQNLMKRRNT
jgi:predicted  nucleic acid-binding Zn-ribbon protein